jgi:hypothetical protein
MLTTVCQAEDIRMIPNAAGSRLLKYIKGFNQSSADVKADKPVKGI